MRNSLSGRLLATSTLSLFLYCGSIAADSISDKTKLTGFMSSSASISNSKTKYVERFDDNINFSDTRIGLNISVDMSDQLGIAGQILMAGREDTWNAHADWLFASYRSSESAFFMGGRIKYPNLLFSEYYDVGKLYPWISAPQELYGFGTLGGNMNYEVFSGISAVFTGFVGDDLEWQLQPYIGHAGLEFTSIQEMYGIAASIGTDEYQLKIAYNNGTYDFGGGGHGGGGDDLLTNTLNQFLQGKDKKVTSIGFSYDANNILILTEWAETDNGGTLLADIATTAGDEELNLDTTVWYVTAGYRIDAWLPFVTVADFQQDSGSKQERFAVGLNYDINPSTRVKFEWQRIKPTAGEEIESAIIDDEGTLGTTDEEAGHPVGLFDGEPDETNIDIIGVSIDFVF